MIVYRIEDVFGVGPYKSRQGDDAMNHALKDHTEDNGHPGPMNEGEPFDLWAESPPKMTDSTRFAFESIASLVAWFEDELPLMARFQVRQYMIQEKDVRKGKSQCAFEIEDAIPLPERDILLPCPRSRLLDGLTDT